MGLIIDPVALLLGAAGGYDKKVLLLKTVEETGYGGGTEERDEHGA